MREREKGREGKKRVAVLKRLTMERTQFPKRSIRSWPTLMVTLELQDHPNEFPPLESLAATNAAAPACCSVASIYTERDRERGRETERGRERKNQKRKKKKGE